MNKLIKLNKKFKTLLAVFVMLLTVNLVKAQCFISTNSTTYCVGDPVQFSCNSPGGSQYNWNFNSEGSNNSNCDPAFTFNTPGQKNITLSMRLANGQTCNANLTITVKCKPIINVKRITQKKQCFANNSFCFTDSSKSCEPGGRIKGIKYLFDDGEIITVNGDCNNGGVPMPRTFCKSFGNPAGGLYGMTIEVEDCNGCINKVRINEVAEVEASLGLSFSSNRPKSCDSVEMIVTNNSTIPLSDIQSFTWFWGDGTTNTTNWGPVIRKTFYAQGPNNGDFNSRLTVTSKTGCTESFTVTASATNLIVKPVIIANFDSVCYKEPEINFVLKDGPIPGAANPMYNYGDPPTGPLNVTRQWVGTHRFSGLGPYKINFSFTHQIPKCGKTVFDTILVIGPQSTIEGSIMSGMRFLEDYQRFQCVIKDTVKFYNFSKFYHNDRNMMNDDSIFLHDEDSLMVRKDNGVIVRDKTIQFNASLHEWLYKGFNYPLIHAFGPAAQYPRGQTSLQHHNQQRGKECVLRVWDFDDDYCEKCTTDTKAGWNVGKNCKWSYDSLPMHWYTPWDSIYMTSFSTRPELTLDYNQDSGLCYQKRMWPSTQWSIIRDTILYYGDNFLANRTKDSSIYANIKNKVKVQRGFGGPTRYDITTATRFFIRAGDTIFIDNNNGFAPNRVIGQRYQTLQAGQTLIIRSKTDSALLNVWLVFIQDTIASNLVQPWHKVWKTETMQGYQVGDSINPEVHRQKFYSGTTVRCFNVRLFHKDTCHVLECEHEAVAQLALMPASAKKLRKAGTQCLGGDQDNYGITFILEDTKPGCTNTFAKINFDTALNKTGWVPAVGANLTPGSIATGNLPPVNPPYQVPIPGYQVNGPPPNRFSKQFTVDDIKDSITGYINVGLIIGNGVWPDPNSPPDDDLNYPPGCIDTIYYEKFARFPILDNRFRITKPCEITPATKICRRDSISLSLLGRNRTYIPDVSEAFWTLDGANVGKFYNQYYRLSVNERYKRFQKVTGQNYLHDSLIIDYETYFDGKTNKWKTVRIPTAKVTKWHTEADITPVFDIIKTILERNRIDIYELTPQQLNDIIWNGQGQFGKPWTGSRGCLDTTGFGRFIRFYQVADEKEILHFRDTSLRPIDQTKGCNGEVYNAYTFAPQYSGFYIANYGLRSIAPENCTKQTGTSKKVIVGYMNLANFNDTIICHGSNITAEPFFRYFEVFPEIFFRLLDPTDYWRNRISEAGNPNREGATKWDLSKDDDDVNDLRTIFGGFPYSQTGMGNPIIKLGGAEPQGSVYYNQDTGRRYIVRVASSDSTGCKDTIEQNMYVTAVRANFRLSTNRPQCKTIVQLFDSSFIQDPCVPHLGRACDKITSWEIWWGDSSRSNYNVFYDNLPPQIGHDYIKNGRFKIRMRVRTQLGCEGWDSTELYIPGPDPFFDTFIPRRYCVNELVKFTNLSRHQRADSNTWLWDFGDNFYDNQYDTIIGNTLNPNYNDSITHRYTKPGKYKIVLNHYYLLQEGTTRKRCSARYPETEDYNEPEFVIEIFPYDSVNLSQDTTICLNDVVKFSGQSYPLGKYSRYIWNTGDTTLEINKTDTTHTHTFSKKGRFTVKFKGDPNSASSTGKVCPGQDSVIVNVSTVKAKFAVDSSRKPVFCFPNASTDADKYEWSYFNPKSSINPLTQKPLNGTALNKDQEFKQSGNNIDMSHCQNFRDSNGSYWACLVAIQTLPNGQECRDTICQQWENNYKSAIRPPNVFTPNKGADNFTATDESNVPGNDFFNIHIEGHSKYDLTIYDRWGVKVFESKNKDYDWNGQVNNTGADCPEGVYFYVLRYRYEGKDEDEPVLNGLVHILR